MKNKILYIFLLLILNTACSNNKIESEDTSVSIDDSDSLNTTSFTEIQEDTFKSKEHYDSLKFNIVYESPFFKQSTSLSSKASYENWSTKNKSQNNKEESPITKYLYLIDGSDNPNSIHSSNFCIYCEKNEYLRLNNPNYKSTTIIHYPLSSGNELKAIEGYVCFDTKDFQGSNIPFEGYVEGNIKEIILDGNKIDFDINSDLFFRQRLSIYIGYNKIPLKIVDRSGRVTKTWLILETERINKDPLVENNINLTK